VTIKPDVFTPRSLSGEDVETKNVIFNFGETTELTAADVPTGNPDLRVTATKRSASQDHYRWRGEVVGIESSNARISFDNGLFRIKLRWPGKVIALESLGDEFNLRLGREVYRVRYIDTEEYPDEAEGDIEPVQFEDAAPEEEAMQCRAEPGNRTIRVLVMYTARARDAAGGRRQIETLISDAIEEANDEVYPESQVRIRIELAGTEELEFEENGFDVMRSAFRVNAEARRKRNQYDADIMSLFVRRGGRVCGTAYVMTRRQFSRDWQGAYNVVNYDCAANNFSFIHEVGHNLGAGHHVGSCSTKIFDYSCGFSHPGRYRTVMSKADCDCPRVGRFSNPRVIFRNLRTGDETRANNARTFNETRCVASDWR
jgi:hypothetical protein